MRKTVQFLLFVVLQVLLAPVALLGLVPMTWKEMMVSKRLGVSFTAGQAIQPRWLMHHLGVRNDEATVAFIKAFPMESHWGFFGVMGAALLANRLCGYVPGIARIPEQGREGLLTYAGTRSIHNDRLARKALGRAQQVVLLGAGFDLRLLEMSRGRDLPVFELDMEATQKLKLATMKAAGIDHDHVQYLSVDFRQEDWVHRLLAAGFDPSKTSYFHWESVSLYLEPQLARKTLRRISQLCAPGSIVVQDLYSRTFISGRHLALLRTGKLFAMMGEPWLFALDMAGDARSSIEAFVSEAGLELGELVLCGGQDGRSPPFYAVLESIKA